MRGSGEKRGLLVLAGESPLPPTSGSRQRTVHLARALAEAFEVELAVLGEAPNAGAEPFSVRPIPHRRSRAGALLGSLRRPYQEAKMRSAAAERYVAEGRWATVQAETPFVASACARAEGPVVLNTHNVEAEVLRSLADRESRPPQRLRLRWEARKTEALERRAVAAAAAVAATSDEDAAILERLGARRLVVVPNGVDCAGIAWLGPGSGETLAYVGHFAYRPNVDAALELIGSVLPRVQTERPRARALVIGRDPPPGLRSPAREGVTVTGAVPDVMPHLRGARVLVAPIRSGGGTRLKVLEALAAGVPVVSTRLGVSGLDVGDGVHVLLAETASELASRVLEVLDDDALAGSLSAAGRRLVEERYDWRVVARPLVELHAALGATR